MIYFDNGATSYPKPQGVRTAVEEAFLFYGANPGRSGHRMSLQTGKKIYECRSTLARFMGAAGAEQVVFTLNCTHSINLCLKGLLNTGDHVIITDMEHNSVLRPIHTLSQAGIITYSILTIHEDEEETLAELAALIQPNTRLFAMTHGSNVFGILTPIRRIAALAGERGILMLVDAAQTAGVIEIDVEKWGIDFLCMPGHKGLYGPTGTGAIVTTRGELLRTIMEGGTGSQSLSYDQPDFMPDKLESGTVNSVGIQGLGAGLQYVMEQGVESLYSHELGLTARIYDGLALLPKVQLYTKRPRKGKSLPVLSFNLEGLSGEETCALLDAEGFCLRGGYHCAPLAHKKMGTLETGTARLSLGAFNTALEADRFLHLVAKL